MEVDYAQRARRCATNGCSYYATPGSTPELCSQCLRGSEAPKSDVSFDIHVRTLETTPTGGMYVISVEPSTTISDVKQTLFERGYFVPCHHRLIYNHQQCADEQTVASYGMRHGSIVFGVGRMRGGKPVITFRSLDHRPHDVAVTLDLRLWHAPLFYPQPKLDDLGLSATWMVHTGEAGKLIYVADDTRLQYPSLFWEADLDWYHTLELSTKQDTGRAVVTAPRTLMWRVLSDLLDLLGFTPAARTEFITYWVPQLPSDVACRLAFHVDDDKYEALAPLQCVAADGATVEIHRVFVCFSPDRRAPLDRIRVDTPTTNGMPDEQLDFTTQGWTNDGGYLWKSIVPPDCVAPCIAAQADVHVFEWGGMILPSVE